MNLILQLKNFFTGNLIPKSHIVYKYIIRKFKVSVYYHYMNFIANPTKLLSNATKIPVIKQYALEQENIAQDVFNYSDENDNLDDVFTDDPLCK